MGWSDGREPDAWEARCLFSVSTIRSLPVSVLILDQEKPHLDLLQLLFTEGDFLWLPYIYVACSGFQFACYEITLLDYAACWRLWRVGVWVGDCHILSRRSYSYATTVPTALNLPFFLHFVPSHKKCIHLSSSAVPDALLPWQPNSPTSIRCLRPGAGTVFPVSSFFPLSFSNIVVLFH